MVFGSDVISPDGVLTTIGLCWGFTIFHRVECPFFLRPAVIESRFNFLHRLVLRVFSLDLCFGSGSFLICSASSFRSLFLYQDSTMLMRFGNVSAFFMLDMISISLFVLSSSYEKSNGGNSIFSTLCVG